MNIIKRRITYTKMRRARTTGEKLDIIIATRDTDFIKQVINDKGYNWSNIDVCRLIASTGDAEFIKQALQSGDFKSGMELAMLIVATPNTDIRMEYASDPRVFNDSLAINICMGKFNISEKRELLKSLKSEQERRQNRSYGANYRNALEHSILKDNIELILEQEGIEEQDIRDKLMEMYSKNNDVLRAIDFRLLDKKYIELLGTDKINQITCYPIIQERILQMNDKELAVFSKCINSYLGENKTDEWTPIAQVILDNISQYSELIEDISRTEEEIDYAKLSIIMQDENIFEIKNLRDVKNYEQIKREKCNQWIKSDDLDTKRLAVLEKIFGQGLEYSKRIVEQYGEDIEKIEDKDCKAYVQSVQAILELDDVSKLDEIYEKCKEEKLIDKIYNERTLKDEYAKLYDKGLFKIEQGVELEPGVYDAGTEFQMIITVLHPFLSHDITENITNYKSDWNQPSIASQNFSASYIRNDMLGTAPVRNICYRIY